MRKSDGSFHIENYCSNLYLLEQNLGRSPLKKWTWVIFVLGITAVCMIVDYTISTNDYHYFEFKGAPTHSFRNLFPRCPLFDVEVIHMEIDQTGLATSALVEVLQKSRKMYQLWVILPLSIYPSSHVMFESPYPFRWAPHEKFQRLIITDHHSLVYILERKNYSHWINTQIFETHAPVPFEIKDAEEVKSRSLRLVKRDWEVDNRGLHLSMTPCSEYILVGNQFSFYLLEYQGESYRFHRLVLPQQMKNIQTFHRGLIQSEKHILWLVSRPYYNQTSGQVDIYKVPLPGHQATNMIEHCHTLRNQNEATFFGENCAFAPRDFLMISARFAPEFLYGAGAVYIYKLCNKLCNKASPFLHQTIRCPKPHNNSEQSVLEFGAMFDVSENGDWLIISSHLAGYGSLYVYRYAPRLDIYFHVESISSPDFLLHEVGRSLCVDNHGNIMIGSQKAVYFSWFNERRRKTINNIE